MFQCVGNKTHCKRFPLRLTAAVNSITSKCTMLSGGSTDLGKCMQFCLFSGKCQMSTDARCFRCGEFNGEQRSLTGRSLPHLRSQKDGVTSIPKSLYHRWEGKPLGNLVARSEALAELGS